MPLAPCPVCKKEISKQSAFCVGCGHPDPFYRRAMLKVLGFILNLAFWAALLVGGAYACWTYLVPYMIDLVQNA